MMIRHLYFRCATACFALSLLSGCTFDDSRLFPCGKCPAGWSCDESNELGFCLPIADTLDEEAEEDGPPPFVPCDGACSPEACCRADEAGLCEETGQDCFCAQLNADRLNCGTCGVPCEANQLCFEGGCACPGGTKWCGEGDDAACFDILQNPKHCGGCGQVCGQGSVCRDGYCICGERFICSQQESCCPTENDDVNTAVCVNLSNNVFACGSCGESCPSGFSCVEGQCRCGERTDCELGDGITRVCCLDQCLPPNECGCAEECNFPTACCGVAGADPEFACYDLGVDSAHCGRCGNACPSGATCTSGSCACESPLQLCGDSCVDTRNDPEHCGGCFLGCPEGAGCVDRACLCPQERCGDDCRSYDEACNGDCSPAGDCASRGQQCCPSGCKDLDSDPNNCGSCGTVCGNGNTCINGRCSCGGLSCAQGESCCNGVCANFESNRLHCGRCGNACAAAEECCDGNCVNVVTSVSNCGACGSACEPGLSCVNRQCVCGDRECNLDEMCCGECIDPDTSPQHCGGCNLSCETGESCCSSYCAELSSDANHCGRCGQSCTPPSVCANSECRPPNPTNLQASDYTLEKITISFTVPNGVDSCRLLRKDSGYPSGPNDGLQLATYNHGTVTYDDWNFVSGNSYYYAVFCELAGSYNSAVIAGSNADTGIADVPWFDCAMDYRMRIDITRRDQIPPIKFPVSIAIPKDRLTEMGAADGSKLWLVRWDGSNNTLVHRVFDPNSGWASPNPILWVPAPTWDQSGHQLYLYVGGSATTPPLASEGEVFYFADFFDRANSTNVGGPWNVTEGGSPTTNLAIDGSALQFQSCSPNSALPFARAQFPTLQGAGSSQYELRVGFDWDSNGTDIDYGIWMLLGDYATLNGLAVTGGLDPVRTGWKWSYVGAPAKLDELLQQVSRKNNQLAYEDAGVVQNADLRLEIDFYNSQARTQVGSGALSAWQPFANGGSIDGVMLLAQKAESSNFPRRFFRYLWLRPFLPSNPPQSSLAPEQVGPSCP